MSTKPQYNTARGEVKLEGMAPFEGVTARVFPLKADIHCLSDFCKRYYNIVPDDIADFRPAVPYIFLAVLHYGKMEFPQLGRWISQNEIAFIIPLEW
jgi:hypothetical protein